MHFERMGTGPALILVPALTCDRRSWAGVADRLADRFTLVFPEIWHCESLFEMAKGVAEIPEALEVPAVGAAGLSMGGYVVFELLRRWPQKFRAAAVLDSTPYPDSFERAEKRRQVLKLLAEGKFDAVLAAFTASVLAPENNRGGPIHDQLLRMARDLGPEGFARCSKAILQRGSFEDVLRTVRVPLLFLAGEHDALSPPEVACRAASQVPGSHAETIPGAGHMTPLEAPERVAELLGSFFAGVLLGRT